MDALGNKASPFLAKLYAMVNNDSADHRECINWTSDNLTFWVSNISLFSQNILTRYFKHNNYASFVRQLNMYSFHRSTQPKAHATPLDAVGMVEHFTHPLFIRGRQDLLCKITRKQSGQTPRGTPGSTPAPLLTGKKIKSDVPTTHEQRRDEQEIVGQVQLLQKNQVQMIYAIQVLQNENRMLNEQLRRQADMLERVLQKVSISTEPSTRPTSSTPSGLPSFDQSMRFEHSAPRSDLFIEKGSDRSLALPPKVAPATLQPYQAPVYPRQSDYVHVIDDDEMMGGSSTEEHTLFFDMEEFGADSNESDALQPHYY